MGLYNNQPATVWMRSIRWHTYEGVPQPEGALYLAHEEMAETIEQVLKFAVREAPPLEARREPTAEPVTLPTVPPNREIREGDLGPIATPRPKRGAKIMTTGDLPNTKPPE